MVRAASVCLQSTEMIKCFNNNKTYEPLHTSSVPCCDFSGNTTMKFKAGRSLGWWGRDDRAPSGFVSSESQHRLLCYQLFGINLLLRQDKLNWRWYAVFQISLRYFGKNKNVTCGCFQSSLLHQYEIPNDHLSLRKGSPAEVQQKDYTNTSTLTNTSWVCTIPNTPFAIHQVKLSADWVFHEEGGFPIHKTTTQTVSLPSRNSHHRQIWNRPLRSSIKQRKLIFLSDFILVHILSILNCLSIFFPLK